MKIQAKSQRTKDECAEQGDPIPSDYGTPRGLAPRLYTEEYQCNDFNNLSLKSECKQFGLLGHFPWNSRYFLVWKPVKRAFAWVRTK